MRLNPAQKIQGFEVGYFVFNKERVQYQS